MAENQPDAPARPIKEGRPEGQPASVAPNASRTAISISWILRSGVSASLVLIVLGLATSFVRHPRYLSQRTELAHLTKPGAAFPQTLPAIAAGVKQFRGQAIVAAGLLLLIATPVVRVAVSLLAFAAERDYVFVLLTAAVLAVLLLSFFLGKVEV